MSCQKHSFPLIGSCNVCGKDDHPEVTEARYRADEEHRKRREQEQSDRVKEVERVKLMEDVIGVLRWCRAQYTYTFGMKLEEALRKLDEHENKSSQTARKE